MERCARLWVCLTSSLWYPDVASGSCLLNLIFHHRNIYPSSIQTSLLPVKIIERYKRERERSLRFRCDLHLVLCLLSLCRLLHCSYQSR